MRRTYPDSRRWWKLPEVVRRAIVAGDLNRSEAICAVAIAAGSPWFGAFGRRMRAPTATIPWLVKTTGLSERAVRYAVDGRSDIRPGLRPYLRRDEQSHLLWRQGIDKLFARVTPAELVALALRPAQDVIRLWAWAAGKLSRGRPWVRLPFVASTAGAEIGWRAGRAWRAMCGAEGRPGAADVGLVELQDGFMVERNPTALAGKLERRRRNSGQSSGLPCAEAVDWGSLSAGASRVRELFQHCTVSKEPVLIVDLLNRWQDKVGQQGGDVWDVAAAGRHLCRLRRRSERDRGWASSVVYKVLHATGYARKAALKAGRRFAPSRMGPRGREGPRGAPLQPG